MNTRKRVYVAAPLFSEAELTFNLRIKSTLLPNVDVFLPQLDGLLMAELLKESIDIEIAARSVFACDVEAVRNSDAVLIVLDGRAVDEGAAFELGLGFALGKTCVGLQTDPRRLFAIGNNPMLTGPLSQCCFNLTELADWAARWGSERQTP